MSNDDPRDDSEHGGDTDSDDPGGAHSGDSGGDHSGDSNGDRADDRTGATRPDEESNERERARDGEPRERREPAETKYCVECGAVINAKAEICPECGVRQPSSSSLDDDARIVAAVLAIVLGGFGAHKFYLGETGTGILYLCFSWTLVPSILGIIEGAIYLSKSDEEFRAQYLDD